MIQLIVVVAVVLLVGFAIVGTAWFCIRQIRGYGRKMQP